MGSGHMASNYKEVMGCSLSLEWWTLPIRQHYRLVLQMPKPSHYKPPRSVSWDSRLSRIQSSPLIIALKNIQKMWVFPLSALEWAGSVRQKHQRKHTFFILRSRVSDDGRCSCFFFVVCVTTYQSSSPKLIPIVMHSVLWWEAETLWPGPAGRMLELLHTVRVILT